MGFLTCATMSDMLHVLEQDTQMGVGGGGGAVG